MPDSLLVYAWSHSRRAQLLLLAVTCASFPVVYIALEVPKRIVNDAIGGDAFPVSVLGMEFAQLQYLALLCVIFLAAVIASGLVKMQLNVMKGVLSERLLRRLRYDLIARIHRFPLPRFRKKSQGELVSMVTGETEPLGGLMGNLIAEPVFQAGQMLTILLFLFLQNVWFALAAIALIPVQAYVIPMLQRRINRLNKARVKKVRVLSAHIGESVAAMPDVRANGATHYFLARFSGILHDIFEIRFQIYQKKFFMKFLNNFINQLTPFFFYAIGGYLVIKGDMTLGALVAALGAFKDLSAPWKSLLTYYNQLQDMSLRYQTIVEQFEMPDNLRAELLDGRPAETPSFAGPVALENVTVLSEDGTPILDALSLEIPAGALAAVQCADPLERDALVQTLSRLHLPAAGRITVNGHDLAAQHQEVIARRIGLVRDTAMLFDGTVGFNFTSAIRLAPPPREQWSEEMLARALEAETVGNCPDPTALSWIDPALAGTADIDGLKAWWLETIEMMGTDGALVRRALDARIDAEEDAELAAGILALRPAFLEALSEAGLAKHIEPFDPKRFHTGLTIFENLLFAVPAERGAVQEEAHEIVAEALERLGYTASFRLLALRLLRSLDRVFADVGPGHPVFRRLPIAADGFQRLAAVYRDSEAVQSRELERLLETVSFSFSAREFPEGVDDQTRDAITRIRCAHGAALRDALGARVSPLVPDAFIAGLTVFQNAIFGKFVGSTEAENSAKQMLADRLEAAGLKGDATITVTEVETGLGGSAMPANARERIAFIRAVLKRPDVLILDRAFVNQEPAQRDRVIQGTKRLLPGVTVIVVEPAIPNPEAYDVVHRIAEGRLVGETPSLGEDSEAEDGALNRKVRALRKTPLFEGLPTGQLHLLAFAADWFSAEPGESVFRVGDAVDGVYVIRKGRGELRVPARGPDAPPVQSFGKGEVIGDVGTLIQSDRRLEMVALAPLRGLKIRKDEYLEIVTHDPIVAKRLLETYAGMIASALIDAEPARG